MIISFRLRQPCPEDQPRQGRHHGLRRPRHTVNSSVLVQRRFDPQQNRQRRLLEGTLLLPLLKLRLLLLRREEDGREGAPHEEEATTAGTPTATAATANRLTGAVLRALQFQLQLLHGQQPPLAHEGRLRQRTRQPQLHRQRVQDVHARAQHPGAHPPLPRQHVHLHLRGDVRPVPIGGLASAGRLLLLFHEPDDGRVRQHGARRRRPLLQGGHLQRDGVVLLLLHHAGHGADGHVLQRRARRDRPPVETRGDQVGQEGGVGGVHRRAERVGGSLRHGLMTVRTIEGVLPPQPDGRDAAQFGDAHVGRGPVARARPEQDARSAGRAGADGSLHAARGAGERRQQRGEHGDVGPGVV